MIVSPDKVKLSERDIEDFLYENPSSISVRGAPVQSWIKRQYKIPNGIADLIGLSENGDFVVVEVKNVEVESTAIAQVYRYAHDVWNIISEMNWDEVGFMPANIRMAIVGPSITDQAFRECEACNIEFHRIEVNFNAVVSKTSWTQKFIQDRKLQYAQLAVDSDFKIASSTLIEILRSLNYLPPENEDEPTGECQEDTDE